LDFFPVLINVSAPPDGEWQPLFYSLRHTDAAVNIVYTSLGALNMDSHLTHDIIDCGSALNVPLLAADITAIPAGGIVLPTVFTQRLRTTGGLGVILVEGAGNSSAPLVLEVLDANGTIIASASLPLLIKPVEEMYTRVNLRNGAAVITAGTALPPHNGKNVIFLHGFRVSEDEARGWHSEMFKRLWQSGSNARFHGVTWHGNYGALEEGVLYYQQNVEHAFQAAPHLALYSEGLSGDKVFMAHSLGNMVVSSAIADHSMNASKFFMLDAAVASEAFDEMQWDESTFQNPMLHEEWVDCHTAGWSSKWHENFFSLGLPNDDRGRLTWKNRFASVLTKCEVYNYWSSGDEVLALFATPDTPSSGTITIDASTGAGLGNHAWQKQERFKGRFGIDLWAGNAGTSWMGWGFADPPLRRVISGIGQHGEYLFTYEDNPATNKTEMLDYLLGNPILPLDFFKCNVLFRGDPAEAFQPVIPQATQNAILAKGIPAMSGPVGSREIRVFDNDVQNVDMNELQWRSGWPRDHKDYGTSWLHSDIRDIAYLYNYKVFDDLVRKGNLE
ncbi:MAG: hypothetical protein GX927_04155, partial [Lentisphaerae bacterium]|nr:hypothetical protein [Lentisphaerota bacterium]